MKPGDEVIAIRDSLNYLYYKNDVFIIKKVVDTHLLFDSLGGCHCWKENFRLKKEVDFENDVKKLLDE